MDRPDIVILGAGPAGTVAAMLAAAQGMDVLIIDSGHPPAARIESLPPMGRALAYDLGLQPALDAAFLGRVASIDLHRPASSETRRSAPADAPDLLDRATLHAALHTLARRSGAKLATGRGWIGSSPTPTVALGDRRFFPRVIIDARGRAALPRAIRNAVAALPFRTVSPAPPPAPRMEVTALAIGWSWIATLPSGRCEGALFTDPRNLAGLTATRRRAVLLSHLALAEDLHVGRPCPAALHAAPFATATGPILRIGDAALARDPVAAHGLVHAFRSATHAVAAAATILGQGDASAALAFLEQRHAKACRQAAEGTALALAGLRGESAHPAEPARAAVPPLNRPLRLSRALHEAPVLANGRIVWAKAIHLPASGEDATTFGPSDAATIAHLLDPPAPVATLARRLDAVLPATLGHAILKRLIDEGALVPSDQTGSRATMA